MANTFNVVENFKYPYTINGVIDAWIHKNNDEDLHIAPQSPIIYNIKNDNLSKYYDEENDIIHFPFDALMMFNEHHETIDPNIGVGFMSYNIDGDLKLTPIDMVINKTAINDIAQFYNKQSGSYTTGGLLTNYVLTKENIYYIIKYLRMYDEYLIDDTMTQMKDSASKYYQLYNDRVDNGNGDFFCEYIYRATGNVYNMEFKDNDSRVYLYKNGNHEFAKIPVFRVDTKNPNVKFYYVIRNFRIPLKRVLTSTYTYGYGTGAQQMYAFIFICPEYILRQYSEYIDSISYMIGENLGENINKDDYKFSYNYLYTDENEVNHLWVHNFNSNIDEPTNFGLKLANTNSTKSFIN